MTTHPTDPRITRLRNLTRTLAAIPHLDRYADCGHPLDPHAPPRSRWSPSVDHRIPRSRGGPMWDPTNLRAVHYGCNARKRDKLAAPKFVRSRAW